MGVAQRSIKTGRQAGQAPVDGFFSGWRVKGAGLYISQSETWNLAMKNPWSLLVLTLLLEPAFTVAA